MAENMNAPILEVNQLSFGFDTRESVLSRIDLNIAANEFVGVIGPNGAGKSTLIKIICGLLGEKTVPVKLFGNAVLNYSAKQISRLIGYVPQNVNIDFSLTVREVVAMGRYPYLQGFWNEDEEGEQQIQYALDWLDLTELQNRPFNQLSGGEQQRVVLAGVLAQQAQILVLDEPTSALDLRHQQEIFKILSRLVRQQNKTVLMVTHDVNLAAQFCDRMVIMSHGRIVANGAPQEVLKFPMIQQVYGVKVYIDINPLNNSLYILPYDLADDREI